MFIQCLHPNRYVPRMVRRVEDDDGLLDLWLGFTFSLGIGLCVVGVGASIVVAFFPEHIPYFLIRILK